MKKSIDASEPRWLSRRLRHVWEGGLRGLVGMKRETLHSLMTMPSLSNSPWIFGAPQVGLASAIRRMSCLTSVETSPSVGVRERDLRNQLTYGCLGTAGSVAARQRRQARGAAVAPTDGAEHAGGGGLVPQPAGDGRGFAAAHSRGVNSPGAAATSAGEARSTLRRYS